MSEPEPVRAYAAAFVIFRRDDGKIAFLLRQNTSWMNNYYGLPSGKVDIGESVSAAAIREAKEEVGVTIKLQDLNYLLTAYRTGDSPDKPWVDVIFEAEAWDSDLINAEPHMHAELAWFHPDQLPENTIPPIVFYMQQIKSGNKYAEYGWEE